MQHYQHYSGRLYTSKAIKFYLQIITYPSEIQTVLAESTAIISAILLAGYKAKTTTFGSGAKILKATQGIREKNTVRNKNPVSFHAKNRNFSI